MAGRGHSPKMLEARLLYPSAVTADVSRRLLGWLLEHGADELTVTVMALAGESALVADGFEDALAPFALPIARRRVPGAHPSAELTREVRLWAFTAESLSALDGFLPGGIFEHETGPEGWLENFTLYRAGELLLGVITHEREGVLRLTAAEHDELEAMGIRASAEGRWVDDQWME